MIIRFERMHSQSVVHLMTDSCPCHTVCALLTFVSAVFSPLLAFQAYWSAGQAVSFTVSTFFSSLSGVKVNGKSLPSFLESCEQVEGKVKILLTVIEFDVLLPSSV